MMDRSTARDYVYAKASGRLAKSFIGARAARLFDVRSLSELWSLVFKTEVPLIPEALLAQTLEKEAEKRFINDFVSFVSACSDPPPVLLALLHVFDYANIKKINFALHMGLKKPDLSNIGKYSMLNYDAWPDMEKITRGTPLSWCKTIVTGSAIKNFEHDLDAQYVRELWRAVNCLPEPEKKPVCALLREELVLQNVVWAIRLKVYYNLQKEEIIPLLAGVETRYSPTDPLLQPAVRILNFPTDSYSDWEKWKYAALLNPHEEGVVWSIDPRWVQRAARLRVSKHALGLFHRLPGSLSVLVPWFTIMQNELDYIRTAAEGLRLSADPAQSKKMAGID